ncbi:hypothetical protein ACLOJK_025513 [Asimina triloba]
MADCSDCYFLKNVMTLHVGWAASCSLSNIQVTQRATGGSVQGAPEYEVTIANNCICSQSNLQVSCAGFSSAEAVDPRVFRPVGGNLCLVNDGRPVQQSPPPITFKYAAQTKYNLTPSSSQVNCS